MFLSASSTGSLSCAESHFFPSFRHVHESRPLRHAPYGYAASRALPWRAQELDQAAARARVLFLRGGLACADDALRRARSDRAARVGYGDRLARRRRGSGARDTLHPVARARARGASRPALDDHAVAVARARALLQGPAGEAHRKGSCDVRLSWLSAAPG